MVIDEEGPIARWVDWQAHGKGVPLAAIQADAQTPMMFVANEVLVDPDERDLIARLVESGATVVESRPLQRPPDDVQVRELTGEFPMPVRMQLEEPPQVEGAERILASLYEASEERVGRLTVTSEAAGRMAAFVGQLVAEGRQIGLNAVGTPAAMPLATAIEWTSQQGGSDPFAWAAFSGRSRIVDAWQLVESARVVSSIQSLVWVAILDGGFWLDAAGAPVVAAGQPVSDFGLGVLQINLQDEGQKAGGTNPNKCGNSTCDWHGNAVASAAVAAVGNQAGAAGSGGTIARPMFFKTHISEDQVYRCLEYCTAWGIDVLNMSFTMKRTELFFGTSAWDNAFNFAVANGVVMVAAAGNGDENNVGQELPDHNVRPATRTPGVITVGALDANDNATGYSNYGSSISIWAPGDNIPVAPDQGNPNGSQQSGTSLASPIVAGVAAMMRAVNPSLDSVAVRKILWDTGWTGTGRVSRGLDAHAAVLAALGGRLPKDLSESNESAAAAAQLFPAADGTLQPLFGGFATKAGADPDYYKFTVPEFSTVTVSLEWYQRLTSLSLLLEADDPSNFGAAEMSRMSSPATGTTVLSGLLATGTYRVLVGGGGNTAYRLSVTAAPAVMPLDRFEPNDRFETATKLNFLPRKGRFRPVRHGIEWGPGIYSATLHRVRMFPVSWVINPDYYELEVPAASVFRIPTVTIAHTDAPVDVTLFDSGRAEIRSWNDVRSVDIVPPASTTCYLKVHGDVVTRYTIRTSLKFDRDAVPGPFQEELEIIPKWWGDPPPFRIFDKEKVFGVTVGEDRSDGDFLAFERPSEEVTVELLALDGTTVGEAVATPDAIRVRTGGLAPGNYALRISRAGEGPGERRPLELRVRPPM